MTDNSSKELASQLKEMAIQNEIDTQVALRKIMLATAHLLESTDPEVILTLQEDVRSLKKRDWYNLTIAVVVAALASAAAWFKR
jgi:hypothetical protein